jgi:signal transduction histidine kinase
VAVHNMQSFHVECRVVSEAKRDRWVEVRSAPRLATDGCVAWDGFILDITARKATESALSVREREYRALIENTPDPILRTAPNGAIIYANPAANAFLHGWSSSVIGAEGLIKKVFRSGQESAGEVLIVEVPHSVQFFQGRAVPEMDSLGNIVSVLLIARDVTELKSNAQRLLESKKQMERLMRHRESIREEERRRLAQDIHEELGQFLTSLHLGVSALSLEFGAAVPSLKTKTNELLALIEITLRSMRDLVSALRPTALDAGIGAGLAWLAEHFSRYAGIKPTVEISGDVASLDDNQATVLFRIAQEALTNIARYAHATQVEIVLTRDGKNWWLYVKDNGQGFDIGVKHKQRFGLLGMSERAAALGGRLDITSHPGQGTCITVAVPAT